MKVLVIGGMHGNEPLGIELVKKLQKQPVANMDTVLANEPAIAANCRFTEQDLNRSFPGRPNGQKYEEKRAATLLKLCKQYDLVLDFHNTHCPNNDCGFVGQTAPSLLYDAAYWLGLRRIIVADYDCINKYAPNCLSVEISLGSACMDLKSWHEKLKGLAKLDKLPEAGKIKKYRFVYRMTLEDRDRLDLPAQGLKAFKPLQPKLAKSLGVQSPAYPIFIDDSYTPYNYGGILNNP